MNLTNIFESTPDFVHAKWQRRKNYRLRNFERTVRGTGVTYEDRGFSGCYGGY